MTTDHPLGAEPSLPPAPAWNAAPDDAVPDDVARLLGTLPEWFGRPESNAEYVADARVKETWTVRAPRAEQARRATSGQVVSTAQGPALPGEVVGVLLVERHFPQVAEIHLMAVDRRHRGRRVGRALLTALEDDARRRGVRLLEVKTLGHSDPDPAYARTREFYAAAGFLPLEETDLWGADTPCLIMVKPLSPR